MCDPDTKWPPWNARTPLRIVLFFPPGCSSAPKETLDHSEKIEFPRKSWEDGTWYFIVF